jgi:nickel transport protein
MSRHLNLAVWVSSLVFAAVPAGAHELPHALGAEAKLKGDRVEVEAYFSDNTPARDARVAVHDAAEKAVADGRTDDQGRWHFARPAAGKYHVVVDAGDGHRARIAVTIPADQAGTATATTASPSDADCDCCTDGVIVSTGPSRAEFTRWPWERVALGLSLIALAAFGWRAFRRSAPAA